MTSVTARAVPPHDLVVASIALMDSGIGHRSTRFARLRGGEHTCPAVRVLASSPQ
jgi:hypothetical protein